MWYRSFNEQQISAAWYAWPERLRCTVCLPNSCADLVNKVYGLETPFQIEGRHLGPPDVHMMPSMVLQFFCNSPSLLPFFPAQSTSQHVCRTVQERRIPMEIPHGNFPSKIRRWVSVLERQADAWEAATGLFLQSHSSCVLCEAFAPRL